MFVLAQIRVHELTLNLLTTTIVAPPSNASKWQMGFNSAFKGLIEWVNYVEHKNLCIYRLDLFIAEEVFQLISCVSLPRDNQ